MSNNTPHRKAVHHNAPDLTPEEIRRMLYERIACGHAHTEADEQAHKIRRTR